MEKKDWEVWQRGNDWVGFHLHKLVLFLLDYCSFGFDFYLIAHLILCLSF